MSRLPHHSLLPGFRQYFALLGVIVLLCACGSSQVGSETAGKQRSSAAAALPTEPSLAPPRPGVYAALGASETYGVGAQPHTNGYAWLVSRALHARRFVNLGIPGTTLNAAYNSELTSALSINPSFATVFFGVNDLRAGVPRDAFLQDLHDLAATLRQAHVRVLIIGMPDLSHLPAVKKTGIGGLRELSASWSAGMRRVARQTGAQFLDLGGYDREIVQHPNFISVDGLHPSNAGYRRLAQVIQHVVLTHRLWTRS
ncbi:MAG: hypothetical protein NVS2B16_03120 [Chloroflexota bacterium]